MPSESQRLDAQPQSSDLPPSTTAQCLSHSIQHNNDRMPYSKELYEMLKLAWLIQPTPAGHARICFKVYLFYALRLGAQRLLNVLKSSHLQYTFRIPTSVL